MNVAWRLLVGVVFVGAYQVGGPLAPTVSSASWHCIVGLVLKRDGGQSRVLKVVLADVLDGVLEGFLGDFPDHALEGVSQWCLLCCSLIPTCSCGVGEV